MEPLSKNVLDPNAVAPDMNNTSTPTLIGHDTATTDEEEAAEALLALCNLPYMNDDDEYALDDNANLMPIGGPSTSIDINPVEVKLSMDNVNQVIEQLPKENKLNVTPPKPPKPPSINKGDSTDTDS